TSLIYTVLTLLAMLIIGPLLAILFQGASLASLSNVAEMPEISGIGTFGAVIAVILVIGVPIIVFISSFISMALTALFYNLIAPKIGGVKFKFKDASHSFCEIKKIPALPLALISSVVLTIVNLIFSLPSFAGYLISGEILLGFGYLIGNIIGNFLSILILYAIMAAIYNFLRPKIGGVEIELD
ncbi:MAG: hypothetical protein Q8N08_02210, partial [Methanobacteriaceae archaeon]|nr:hypothetical protein [Methanobacteriaceae archaeon]